MPRGKHVHKLSNVDFETKRADCAECGPDVEVRIRVGNKPRCREALRAERRGKFREDSLNIRDRRPGRHGLTLKEVRAIKEGESCYICGTTENLAVDHDHTTGELRGVLCGMHNRALGFFKDHQEHLLRAIEYLRNPPGIDVGRIMNGNN